MIVADTTPLSVFLRSNHQDLLGSLFAEIWIPGVVAAELDRGRAAFGGWRARLPGVTVHTLPPSPLLDVLRQELDAGESEAIALALEHPGQLLLIDERHGRAVAKRLGVPILGSVGAVLLAKEQGLIQQARPLIDDLRERGGLWLSESFYSSILRRLGEWA